MELSRKELEAQERLLENNLKISLLVEINEVLQQRQEVVQRHNLLLKNIRDLQNQVQDTTKWIEGLWDKKVDEARQKGVLLENEVASIRGQIAAAQQGSSAGHSVKLPDVSPQDGPKSAGKEMPSRKANYKITASRLQGEIKGLQQRVNGTKLRLLNEIKVASLRLEVISLQNAAWLDRPYTNKQQTETEVRHLRMNLSTSRHGSKASSAVATPLPGYSPRLVPLLLHYHLPRITNILVYIVLLIEHFFLHCFDTKSLIETVN